jgi:hypothetical protein
MGEDYSWGAEARRLAMQDPDRAHLRGAAARQQEPMCSGLGRGFGATASVLAVRVVGNGYILDDGRGATLVARTPDEVCAIVLEALTAERELRLGPGNVGG